MGFEGFDDNAVELSVTEVVAEEVDARNVAATEVGDEKTKAHSDELSGTSTRPDRFGVGKNSKGQLANAAQRSKTANSFHVAALATGYDQPVTFNVGGRGVSMSLRDLNTVASDRFNHYGNQILNLKSQGASQDQIKTARKRMNAYGDLLRMTDQVARGEMSQAELNQHIQDNGLGEEIVDTALSQPDIVVEYTEPQAAAVADTAALADSTASEKRTAVLASVLEP